MKATLLHVEDDEDDQIMLRECLTGPGMEFRIETANSVAAGLSCLRQNSVDLILADLSLPDSSGIETFLRLHEESPALPIVLLTGCDDENLAVQLLYGRKRLCAERRPHAAYACSSSTVCAGTQA